MIEEHQQKFYLCLVKNGREVMRFTTWELIYVEFGLWKFAHHKINCQSIKRICVFVKKIVWEDEL